MVEQEPLTRWEVRDMITTAIRAYDRDQEARHAENSLKLDQTNAKIDKLIYLVFATLATVVGGILTAVVVNAMHR